MAAGANFNIAAAEKSCPISSIPNEALANIFRFLSYQDVKPFQGTCRKFKAIGSDLQNQRALLDYNFKFLRHRFFERHLSRSDQEIKQQFIDENHPIFFISQAIMLAPQELVLKFSEVNSDEDLKDVPCSALVKISSEIITRVAALAWDRAKDISGLVGKGYILPHIQAFVEARAIMAMSQAEFGDDILTKACSKDANIEEIRYLVSMGAKPNNSQEDRKNTLHECIKNKNSEEIILFLLSIGAKSQNFCNRNSGNTLSSAISAEYSEDIIIQLIDAGATFQTNSRFQERVIEDALYHCLGGKYIEKLLEAGGLPTARSLRLAFRRNFPPSPPFPYPYSTIKKLIESGAKITNNDYSGEPPREDAPFDEIRRWYEQQEKIFQEPGTLSSAVNSDQSIEILRLLADHGAKPDNGGGQYYNTLYCTELLVADSVLALETVQFLVEIGAKPPRIEKMSIVDFSPDYGGGHVKNKKNEQVIRYLAEKFGTRINIWGAIIACLADENFDKDDHLIHYLLDQKPKPKIRNAWDGYPVRSGAINYALKSRRKPDTIRRLLEMGGKYVGAR